MLGFAVGIVLGVALLAGCRGEESPAPESELPAVELTHVVLITLDTTRADALGVYGQGQPTTPHIDRMSGEGLRFDQAMSAAPTTLPSHATILTGKLPFAHGARSNSGYVLPEANETLAEVLRRHGFATAAEIAAPVIGRHTQLDQGFAVYRDTLSAGVKKKAIAVRPKNERPGGEVAPPSVIHLDERSATDITDRGIEFVRAHRTEKSFLWLHYFDPHAFYAPPQQFGEQFPQDPYLAEVSYVDSEIGRFLATLRGLALEASTLVVLTADHGEGRNQHNERNHAFFLYDTTMRVPLVLWGPSVIRRGSLVNSLVRTADIAPTILDLLGLPPFEGVQGKSLTPLVTGASKDLGLTGYGESAELLIFGTSMMRTVREGPWKYIHKLEPELYDVVADPGEASNLASARPEIVERLRARLAQLISETPAAPRGAEVPVDSETRDQLQALGYAAATPSAQFQDSLSSLELAGTDPSKLVEDIRVFIGALGAKKRQRYDRAEKRFAALWEKFRTASFGVFRAETLIKMGQFEPAIDQLEQVIALAPEDPAHLTLLADTLMKAGRQLDARKRLDVALSMSRCDPKVRILLARAAFVEKNYREQHDFLRVGVAECPKSEDLWNDYAYALATCPDTALRNGEEALRLAVRVSEIDGGDISVHIDTLAAAHAELGDFAAAVAVSRKSIAVESGRATEQPSGENPNLELLERHLLVFEAGQPLRDPSVE